MIDDIKDLSVLEQEKLLARRRFTSYFVKCIWGALLATVIMTLFAIYMVSDFNNAFTTARAAATSGRMVTTLMLMVFLMLGIYGLNPTGTKKVRIACCCAAYRYTCFGAYDGHDEHFDSHFVFVFK